MMKSSFFLFLLILFSVSCFAQNTPVSTQITIPVEEFETYVEEHGGIPDGANLHDVNNVRANYTGTWEGSYDNKELTIVINQGNITRGDGINEDIMYLRYKLEDSQGNTIISTLNLPSEDPLVCEGLYFLKTDNGQDLIYALYYQGEEIECNQKGEIYLAEYLNDNQLEFFVVPIKDIVLVDCSDNRGAHILPTIADSIIITKVED